MFFTMDYSSDMSVLIASGINMSNYLDRAMAMEIDIYKHKTGRMFYLVVDTTDEYGMPPRKVYTVYFEVCWCIGTNTYTSLPDPSIQRSNPLELLIMTGKTIGQWFDVIR